MKEIEINSIIIPQRFRKDLGDIPALAESIDKNGLHQPIGIDKNGNLIFGHRRFEAARYLRWETIIARIIDTDPLQAEYDENVMRKDFTPSERVAIGRAIEEKLGSRQGQRTDIAPPEPVQNFAQVEPGQKTRELAAKVAGYGNAETYRQAKNVVDRGTRELVTAMDQQEISVSAAAKIAKLPQPEQNAAIDAVKTKSGTQAVLVGRHGNEWYTPSAWIERARSAMGSIDMDPASNAIAQEIVKANDWFDKERDGLKHDWPGNVWMNPPYSRGLTDQFIRKICSQFQACITKQAVVLVDNRTDTQWFHSLACVASAVAFTRRRVNFYNNQAEITSPKRGSAIFYLGPNVQAFTQAFGTKCVIFPSPINMED